MARIEKWFATSQANPDAFQGSAWAADALERLIHAKRLGTTSTACGANTLTWHKYWEDFRLMPQGRVCRPCADIVGGHRPQGSSLVSATSL